VMDLRSEMEPDETRCLELVKLEAEVSKSSTAPTVCEQGPHSLHILPMFSRQDKACCSNGGREEPHSGEVGKGIMRRNHHVVACGIL
jgi:hypothetical protein